MADPKTIAYYQNHAGTLAQRYRLAAPLPLDDNLYGKRVLDVGCGSGRDLLRLLEHGADALGCDPSDAMLDQARESLRMSGYPPEGRLAIASLPDLSPYPENSLDAIHCSAVLMHLPREYHFDAMCRMHQLLKPGGTLQVSFPLSRPGIDPATSRDPDGRLFLTLDPDELTLLCERIGYQRTRREDSDDTLGREGITWCTLRFTKLSSGMKAPLQQVEQILNRDKKSATYKLALFRALAELAQTRPNLGTFTGDGHVRVPVNDVAEKWILYYWPLLESPVYLPQQNGERPGCTKPTAVRSSLRPLVDIFQSSGGFQSFASALDKSQIPPDAEPLLKAARQKIQHTIWNMPVRYAGGGDDFSVLQYDRPTRSIVMQADLWRELCLTGSWIVDATVLRWAELTHKLSGGTVSVSQVVEQLLIIPDPERRVREAREFYQSRDGLTCVWTDAPIRASLEVDHAIPFTLWRSNALWNLFPSTRSANNQKRDKLPTLHLLRHRRDSLIDCWRGLRTQFEDRFEREALTLLEKDRFPAGNWEILLFSRFSEAIETTAHLRGSDRWQPEGISRTRQPDVPVRSAAPYPKGTEQIILVREATNQHPTTYNPQQTTNTPKPATPIPFQNCLPLVASLAAGDPFHGFQTDNLEELDGLDWLSVPEHLCKPRRFIVQVAGDSMEPTLPRGSKAVFEYHRHAQKDGQIVIANLDELGSHHGTETIKRLHLTPTHYQFTPDNPDYPTIHVEIETTDYPILGTFVAKL